MSFALTIPPQASSHRPFLQRSRSHTTPSRAESPLLPDPSEPQSSTTANKRPSHIRSSSYLSPEELKPRVSSTLPAESSPATQEKEKIKHSHRLHIPGSSRLRPDNDSDPASHHFQRRHRYTQSETQQYHRGSKRYSGILTSAQPDHAAQDSNTSSLANLVAGLNAEKDKARGGGHNHHRNTNQQYGDYLATGVPGTLTRMISTHSYRGGGTDSSSQLQRRTTSGGTLPRAVKPSIEADIDRAERARQTRLSNLTKQDLEAKDQEIATAEEEMRSRLADINVSAMDITRRLDYGYYNLLEKVGNLAATIHSFNSLTEQSRQLLENFETETDKMDDDIRHRIDNFKYNFQEREERVTDLENRGTNASLKAEELGRRLENSRTILQNWEKRENQARKVWGRFWGGLLWTGVALVVLVFAIILGKEWWFRGDPVKAGFNVPGVGSRNASLALGNGGKGERRLAEVGAKIPEDVLQILVDIEEKNSRIKKLIPDEECVRKTLEELAEKSGGGAVAALKQRENDLRDKEKRKEKNDERLHVLDEL